MRRRATTRIPSEPGAPAGGTALPGRCGRPVRAGRRAEGQAGGPAPQALPPLRSREPDVRGPLPELRRKYGPGPGIVIAIVAAAIVGCILLLGGCALLLQAGIDAVEDEVDERAITKGQFDSMVPGDTESSVRIRLGKPLSEDTYANKDLECLYYAEKGGGLLSIDNFELCFRDGVLVSKHAD